ncbi:MAG: hypothetical protein ACFB15_02845 [Cyclobacteriaceae bacterium]
MKWKSYFCLAGLPLLCLVNHTLSAQKVIPVEDRMLRDSIAENASRSTKQAGYLTVINRLTKNTRDEVEATRSLQYDYQSHLRRTLSTAALGVSDQQSQQQAVLQLIHTGQHLQDYGFAQSLNEAYHTLEEPLEKSRRLYDHLVPYDEMKVFSDLISFNSYQQAQLRNMLALEEMSSRRKAQLAQALRQLAQQKIRQADELKTKLTEGQTFSMTEAERLKLLSTMQQYLLASQQLNAQSDELLEQVSRPSSLKEQALERYKKAQIRKTAATTPLFNF